MRFYEILAREFRRLERTQIVSRVFTQPRPTTVTGTCSYISARQTGKAKRANYRWIFCTIGGPGGIAWPGRGEPPEIVLAGGLGWALGSADGSDFAAAAAAAEELISTVGLES